VAVVSLLDRTRSRLARRPRVTVVIPTYNWATVLPRSIGSVLAQTMADFELLVIGDGCTDESEQVVRAVRDRRVSWHNLPQNGRSQVGPNNLGLQLARGPYVAYLGHDDLWLPDHLSLLCAALDAGAPLVHGHQLRVDPGRQPYVFPGEQWVYQPADWLPPTSMMHRRDDARHVGGWRFPVPGQHHDPESDLWDRLAAALGTPVCLPEVTSVKLPAGLRAGVYRERPCDEQAAWWARIQAASDSESFVAAALADPSLRPPERYSPDAVAPEFTGAVRADAIERHRAGRRTKGLPD
jgi:glycosyltransferase involved in cell wall biosynthesis